MRKQTIQIKVSVDEKLAIEKQAERENFHNVSAFLRKLALDRAWTHSPLNE